MIDDDIKSEEIIRIEKKPALILLSGGMDSAVVLHLLLHEEIPVNAICFDYGQEAVKEIQSARDMCTELNVPFEVIDISNAGIAGNLGEGNRKENFPDCVVPNRNAIFLTIATAYAIEHNINYIYYGATGHVHTCYPDTQPEFVYKFNELNKVSDIHIVQLRAPLIFMDDYDVLELASGLDFDMNKTWSCYRNTDKPCGTCNMCTSKQDVIMSYLDDLKYKEQKIISKLSNYETIRPEVEEALEDTEYFIENEDEFSD